jgi:hypothetical protein
VLLIVQDLGLREWQLYICHAKRGTASSPKIGRLEAITRSPEKLESKNDCVRRLGSYQFCQKVPECASKPKRAKVCCQMGQVKIEQKRQIDRTKAFCHKVPQKPRPQKSAVRWNNWKSNKKDKQIVRTCSAGKCHEVPQSPNRKSLPVRWNKQKR